MAELKAQVHQGNHQKASQQPEKLKKKIHREVEYGYAVPVSKETVFILEDAMAQPCNLNNQFMLTETGERVSKKRLTHIMSKGITKENASINDRADISRYPAMIYGFCLLRIIHFIVALRLAFPNERILINKFNFSDAYQRIAHTAQVAAQTILIVGELAFICLRLSFGGSVNPPTWCSFSKMVTDLSNELPLIPDWDPETLHSPLQPAVPPPEYVSDSVPLGQAKPMAVNIPTTGLGWGDMFIDDIIKVFINRLEQIQKHGASAPLAIHTAMRLSTGESEPVPHRQTLSMSKLAAEGTPKEIQVVLGWLLDTRRLILALPQDKYLAWKSDIKQLLDSGSVNKQQLKTIIGRLNHAAYVLPLSRHFLSNLRERLGTIRYPWVTYQLNQEERNNLKLWLVASANKGISLNGLTL